jgi:hypothetical protein
MQEIMKSMNSMQRLHHSPVSPLILLVGDVSVAIAAANRHKLFALALLQLFPLRACAQVQVHTSDKGTCTALRT